MKTFLTYTLALTIVPLFVLVYLFKTEDQKIHLPFVRKYTAQLTKQNSISLKDISPYRLRVFGNEFYIYDLEKNIVYQMDQKGKTIHEIGNDNNPAFKLIINYTVDSNSLQILDERARKFYSIRERDNKLMAQDTMQPFLRALPFANHTAIIGAIDQKNNDINFLKINSNKKLDSFKTPLPYIPDGGFANDGFFSTYDRSNKLAYILYHLGKFMVFDSTGKFFKLYNTIDNYQQAPVVANISGRFTLSRKTLTTNRVSANNNHFLYLVSNLKSMYDYQHSITGDVIDIYDLDNGNYINSYAVGNSKKDEITDICLHDEYLYLLTKTGVEQYKIH